MSERHETVVLGGGLAGLSFAYHFDRRTPVFERESTVGGLTRTVAVGPYRFDLAPHLLHFRDEGVKDLVLNRFGVPVETQRRVARIWFRGRLIPYPFELNLSETPDIVRDECLDGLSAVVSGARSNEDALRSGSFADYVMRAFGPGIAKHYLLPYNEKIWSTSPDEMTCEWMRFLPTADLEQIKRSAFEQNDHSFGYNTTFYYPKTDGIRELADAFERELEGVHVDARAARVDTERKIVTFEDGRSVAYRRLVSTIPLKTLAHLTRESSLIELGEQLINTTVYVVNVVIRGDVPSGVHWIYFPEPDSAFYRASLPKNYFARAAPDGEHIISVEVSRRGTEVDVPALVDKVVEQLKAQSLFDIDSVVRTHVETIQHAYCIYDRKRTAVVDALVERLRSCDIETIGRYGRWEYSSMEDAILYGIRLAERWRGQSVESGDAKPGAR